ncbi:MAG: hypothetical protein HND44_02205 [Chloroflexi bacterium]|nr:C39 family peptidase [Ardenticatenaceae bacterium]MBL1127312.1 hypothetical protein [Chloroflexota bacterium]NOG33373.1 hypothetical protein [Chloroflexota bacterium]
MSQPFLVIPHFAQSADGQCLPACARMMLAHSAVLLSESEVAKVLEAKSYGAPSFAIKKLRKPGFTVNYREWSITEVTTALAGNKPVLIFVRTGFLEYWPEDVAHAVIIVGVEQDRQFWVNDPARADAPIAVSWDGLLAAWGEFGYRGATISKK